MLTQAVLSLLLGAGALASPTPQGPNTISQYNPTIRTQANNETYMVLPLNFDVVQSVVFPRKLVPITADSSKYPNGWPAGTHPVIVRGGLNSYIEQLGLEIPNFLMHGAVHIPCVDALNDGKSCFIYSASEYIGGTNGQLLSGLVPAAVSTLEGNTDHMADFQPNDGSAALVDIGGGQYNFKTYNVIVPNPVSGPAVAPTAFNMLIKKVASSRLLTAKGFHSLISQVQILNNGLCQRNPNYFNETFARPFFCTGTTTIYDFAGLNGLPSQLAGTFTNGSCLSFQGETLGANPQPCDQAYAQNDPAALQ